MKPNFKGELGSSCGEKSLRDFEIKAHLLRCSLTVACDAIFIASRRPPRSRLVSAPLFRNHKNLMDSKGAHRLAGGRRKNGVGTTKGGVMKKVAVFLLFMALSVPLYADNFAQKEADRSGLSGTMNAIGNSISGFFNSIGESWEKARAGAAVHNATK